MILLLSKYEAHCLTRQHRRIPVIMNHSRSSQRLPRERFSPSTQSCPSLGKFAYGKADGQRRGSCTDGNQRDPTLADSALSRTVGSHGSTEGSLTESNAGATVETNQHLRSGVATRETISDQGPKPRVSPRAPKRYRLVGSNNACGKTSHHQLQRLRPPDQTVELRDRSTSRL
jgi:hypothetical protein